MKSLLEVYRQEGISFEQSQYIDKGLTWSAPYLYKKVEELGLAVETVCIRHLDLSRMPWQSGDVQTLDTFLYQMVRVQNTDLSIPIVMGWDGYIMDGWHRLAKAILEGKKTIKAYRFEKYIDPDGKSEN